MLMSWHQENSRQDVQSLLLEIVGVDPQELVRQVLEQKLAELGLSYEVSEDADREEGGGMSNSFNPRMVKFSDGRVFVETLTETVTSNDWGSDFYGFVEAGKPYEITRITYDDDGDTHTVASEQVPGDDIYLQLSAAHSEMTEEVKNFYDSHGITLDPFLVDGTSPGIPKDKK